MKVGLIGGGIAGLCTATTLKSGGFDVGLGDRAHADKVSAPLNLEL